MKFAFTHKDKLKSRKTIERLFKEGKSLKHYPFLAISVEEAFPDGVMVKTGFSVSKKSFRKAVDRNRIKRLMREAFRLNKNDFFNNITTPFALMILYIGSEKPTFRETEKAIKGLLEKLNQYYS